MAFNKRKLFLPYFIYFTANFNWKSLRETSADDEGDEEEAIKNHMNMVYLSTCLLSNGLD